MSDVMESFDVGALRVRIFPTDEPDVYLVIVYDDRNYPVDVLDGETAVGMDAAIALGHEMAEVAQAKLA